MKTNTDLEIVKLQKALLIAQECGYVPDDKDISHDGTLDLIKEQVLPESTKPEIRRICKEFKGQSSIQIKEKILSKKPSKCKKIEQKLKEISIAIRIANGLRGYCVDLQTLKIAKPELVKKFNNEGISEEMLQSICAEFNGETKSKLEQKIGEI